jgi:SAM-dependent methyltransferase
VQPHEPRAGYEYREVGRLVDHELMRMCVSYFDAESDRYDEFDRRVERRRRYLAAVNRCVVERLRGLGTGAVVLSFGCGTGRREGEIASSLGHTGSIVGIESSARMAAIAAARGIEVIPDLDAPDRPLPDSVDAVLCLYSFIHLPSPASRVRTLRGLVEMLRPGGLLIIDVFNLHDRYEWLSKIADGGCGLRPPLTGEHRGDVLYRRIGQPNSAYMHYFTLAEAAQLLEDAGLVICEVTGVGHGNDPGSVGVPLDAGCLLFTCVKPVS